MDSTLAQSVLVVLAALTLIAVLVVLVFVVLRRGSGSTEAAGVVNEIESVASGVQELRDSVLTRLTAFQAEAQKMIDVHTNLEQMLRVPGPRGRFGEMALGILLKDQLPEGISVFFQEEIANGKKPDAYILVDDQKICIDSKFLLDDYYNLVNCPQDDSKREQNKKKLLKAFRGHLEKVESDYVQPHIGTAKFALLFVPSEAVYYYLAVEGSDVLHEFVKRGVQVVSPLLLSHKLQLLSMHIGATKLNKRAEEVQVQLQALKYQFDILATTWDTFSRHLRNASTQANALDSQYKSVRQEFDRIHQ